MKKPPIFKRVRSAYGVTEYRLENGLCVLYKREKSAPVVAVCVTFHVGSRNEAKGHTGATHILEHLLFKDSKKYNQKNGKAITDYLEWFGAYINATTWVDRTNYFEVIPRERLEDAVALEADRMRGSLFTDADLASEMTVVRNEYERSRNNPFELLEEEVWNKAFTSHPYRIPTIGLKEDIEGSTAKKLRDFYDEFYWPENATLSIFGDVSEDEMRRVVLKYFAPIGNAPQPIPAMDTVEPEQKETRSVRIKKPMGLTIASVSYKVPHATHKDFPAIVGLMTILASGYASRLQKKMVDTGRAIGVSTSCPALRDPGLASITAHVAHGTDPEKILTMIRTELRSLARTRPTKAELDRAKERLLAQSAYEHDGVFTEIRAVSEATAAGDWTFEYRLENLLSTLTPRDISAAAREYFVSTRETNGILRP